MNKLRIALPALLAFFVGCAGGAVDAGGATPAQERDLPDLHMQLGDEGIQVSAYDWPGHGTCIVFGESMHPAEGVAVSLAAVCDTRDR